MKAVFLGESWSLHPLALRITVISSTLLFFAESFASALPESLSASLALQFEVC